MEPPEQKPPNSTAVRHHDLKEQVIKMLFESDPNWRRGQTPPKPKEMERLAEDAEFVLRTVETHLRRPVHAYQLFAPEGPMMTMREIAARFKEFGWSGKSHNMLRSYIRKLLASAENEVATRVEAFAGVLTEGQDGRMSVGEFFEQLDGEVIQLLDRLGIAAVVTDSEGLERAVVASICKMIGSQIIRSSPECMAEDPTLALATCSFMPYVCGATTLQEFEAREEHSVRPYELFLFASQHGHLDDKLTINADKLEEGAETELGRLYRSSLSILEAHGGGDDEISAWTDKEDDRS